MKLDERELREILGQLADLLSSLERLAHGTELSERQATLVGHALRSGEALAGLLREPAARDTG